MDKQHKQQMQAYAAEHDVPIIEDDGLAIVTDILAKYEIKSILEIGTAIGYSALCMNDVDNAYVFTIERDEKMYNKAVENIAHADKSEMIKLNFGDALLDDFAIDRKFDMLYIDAAKSQYRRFFEKYEEYLNEGGIVVFDNLKFHGYVDMELSMIKSRNLRQLIRKLKVFNDYLPTVDGYRYEYIDQGDGIGILIKETNE